MIEIFIHYKNELMVLETEIDLSLKEALLYKKALSEIFCETGDMDFKIVLIRGRNLYVKNIALYAICCYEYFREEREKIRNELKEEFRDILELDIKKNIDLFLDELTERTKHLDLEYERLLREKYEISKEADITKKIRGLYSSEQ